MGVDWIQIALVPIIAFAGWYLRSGVEMVRREKEKLQDELNMMGSDDVVRALNELMQYSYGVERDGTSPKPEEMLRYWGRVLLAIRRDLGNKRTKLMDVDMLRGQIRDIDQVITSST